MMTGEKGFGDQCSFYATKHNGCKIKGNEAKWPEFITEQLKWALSMRQVIAELRL